MLLPVIVWYVLFEYAPMYGIIISFKDFRILEGIGGSPWATPWYKHFKFFFDSPYFVQLLRNTLLISVYKIIFGFIPPIFLAVVISECRVWWLKHGTQTIVFAPHFLSYSIIYGIVFILLSESSGLVNNVSRALGQDTINFLTSRELFRSVLVGSDVWRDAGFGAILYLAAIAGINPLLYEAAEIDGASRLQRIWHITLPGLRSVFIVLLLLSLGQVLNANFEQIYIFYNVQVYPVADVIDTWVFRTGLEQLNFSLATAVGLFKGVIGFALIVVANQVARRYGESLW